MGVVWEAEDLTLGRRVALKILNKELSEDSGALARFRHEARAAAGINHPHVVQVHEVGLRNGIAFLAMELLPDGSAVFAGWR